MRLFLVLLQNRVKAYCVILFVDKIRFRFNKFYHVICKVSQKKQQSQAI